ncbi:MAG: hypothetical protein ABW061_02895 [Polyangiaceae bacterium]
MKPLDSLRALGPGSEPPAEVKQRVAGALFATLAASALTKPPVSASVHPAPSLLGGVASSKVLAVAAGIWLAGGVAGAALYRALRPAEVRVMYLERPAPPIATAVPSAIEPAVELSAPSTPSGPASAAWGRIITARERKGTGSENSSELARERALLDRARADAAHGEPGHAFDVTEQHRQRFPQGRLTEEREALAIRALLSLGRTADARARAQTFRSTYPNSFLMPALESALSSQ